MNTYDGAEIPHTWMSNTSRVEMQWAHEGTVPSWNIKDQNLPTVNNNSITYLIHVNQSMLQSWAF